MYFKEKVNVYIPRREDSIGLISYLDLKNQSNDELEAIINKLKIRL
ncbi:hypothetical protein RRG54_01890 [Mycoplasmopsis felis]